MGKKKGKHRKHDRHDAEAPPFVVPPQVAGIAAAALKQVDTPAFRQMVAGALGAAAQAFDRRRETSFAAPPVPPEPPVAPAAPPVPPEPPVAPAAPPRADPPGVTLSPEAQQAIEQVAVQAAKAIEGAAALASQAIGTAAAALDRLAKEQGRPGSPDEHAPRAEG